MSIQKELSDLMSVIYGNQGSFMREFNLTGNEIYSLYFSSTRARVEMTRPREAYYISYISIDQVIQWAEAQKGAKQ